MSSNLIGNALQKIHQNSGMLKAEKPQIIIEMKEDH